MLRKCSANGRFVVSVGINLKDTIYDWSTICESIIVVNGCIGTAGTFATVVFFVSTTVGVQHFFSEQDFIVLLGIV